MTRPTLTPFPAVANERLRFGRQENVTLGIVTSLFHEMAPLFPDEYFNIGSDETFSYANAVGPNCT